jgi:hypothetical protein
MSADSPQSGMPIADAAKHLGVTVEMLRKRAQRGTLPAYKVDGRWFIVVSEHDDQAPVQDETTVQDVQDRTSGPGHDVFKTTTPTVTPAAFSQLEAIRDQWLRPFVDDLNVKSERIGQLQERLATTEQRALAAEQERDQLRRRIAETEAAAKSPESPVSAQNGPGVTIGENVRDESLNAPAEPSKRGLSAWLARLFGS